MGTGPGVDCFDRGVSKENGVEPVIEEAEMDTGWGVRAAVGVWKAVEQSGRRAFFLVGEDMMVNKWKCGLGWLE